MAASERAKQARKAKKASRKRKRAGADQAEQDRAALVRGEKEHTADHRVFRVARRKRRCVEDALDLSEEKHRDIPYTLFSSGYIHTDEVPVTCSPADAAAIEAFLASRLPGYTQAALAPFTKGLKQLLVSLGKHFHFLELIHKEGGKFSLRSALAIAYTPILKNENTALSVPLTLDEVSERVRFKANTRISTLRKASTLPHGAKGKEPFVTYEELMELLLRDKALLEIRRTVAGIVKHMVVPIPGVDSVLTCHRSFIRSRLSGDMVEAVLGFALGESATVIQLIQESEVLKKQNCERTIRVKKRMRKCRNPANTVRMEEGKRVVLCGRHWHLSGKQN